MTNISLSLRIRLLTEQDIAACSQLYVDAYKLPCYGGGAWDEPTARRIITHWRQLFPQECFVAERQGQILGFILCSSIANVRAVVEELAVAPEYQNRGVGSALLHYVMEFYRQRGVPYMELIANRHAPAYAFYLKQGFRENRTYRLMSRAL